MNIFDNVDDYSVEIDTDYLSTDYDYVDDNQNEEPELDSFGEDIEFE